MKFVANEKELKEYFDGLSRMLRQSVRDAGEEREHSSEHLAHIVQTVLQEELSKGRERDAASLKELLGKFADRTVSVNTEGGSVMGSVAEMGDDFVVINEPGGVQVLVQLRYISSLHLQS